MTAAFLFSLLFASAAFPQCNYASEYSGAYRASYLDLAANGTELWAATGYGVQLFEQTEGRPALIDTMLLPGVTRSVRVAGGFAYAAANDAIHVLRRNGSSVDLVRTLDAGASINDIEIVAGSVVAATTSGIVSFDASGASRVLASGRNVFSLTVINDVIYAADGDTSIESYVQGTPGPSLTSTVRATSVNAFNGRLLASDGQQTDVFVGVTLTRAATIPYGATSVASQGGDIAFVAGTDRELRALDLRVVENPVELFEGELIPTGGTINRVSAMVVAGDLLYVAGGDAGLAIFDLSGFTAPFPLLGYRTGGATSVASDETSVFVANASGGISSFRRSSNGSLLRDQTWAMGSSHILHRATSNLLLSSSGRELTYWALPSANPVSRSTFRDAVRAAVVRGSTAYVLLNDGTLWSADLSSAAPSPVQVNAAGSGRLGFLAGANGALATAEVSETGTTTVRFYGNGDPSSTPVTESLDGATTTLAASGSRVALFTFAGIVVIDFATSPARVTALDGSRSSIVTDLVIAGSDLVSIAGNIASVYDLASGRLERTFLIPAEAIAVDAAGSGAVIATSDGVVSLNSGTSSGQPVRVTTIAGNKYYRKAVVGRDRLYLFDGVAVDVFDTYFAGTPRFLAAVTLPGLIDVAASNENLYALSNSGTITQLTRGGETLRSVTISQGADAVPLSITTVAGVPWVSISAGCLSTGCEKRTLVFDPVSLTQTASLSGGIVDVVTSGARAYALFDLPRETRGYDVSDPLHPSQFASRASEENAAAIAFVANTVLVVAGDRLHVLNESTLNKFGEGTAEPAVRGAADILVDGNCALTSFAGGSELLPGTLRSGASANGRVFLLTDYVLQISSRIDLPTPNRRRAVR